ncbi:hypothetical protein CHS0354_027936 [Potamilus streckersoni]|uniref:Arb2 domain-containing protein n=1 Tax=Potamilus streckersoni TaxID=2493646 RepID=A0AAE0TB30_9BIVA|nr:hypothetical protein CHS0354_027936 [Potamilus streckersoni]
MGGIWSKLKKMNSGEDEQEYEFPNSLEGFGYRFNKEGQLRKIDTDELFEFNVQEGNYSYNQKHYNALGDILTNYIYNLMETEQNMKREYLPIDAGDDEPRSFVFVSDNIRTNTDKLMILVHGSGAVRAGQWARRLIINEGLDIGTQLPYIRRAHEHGYSVIVANANINNDEKSSSKKKKPIPIRGNSSPEEHMKTLWTDIVRNRPAKHIAIVAHSYGGVSLLELVKDHIKELKERVFAIALTDSVHSMRRQEASEDVIKFYKERACNWASAYDPLDAVLITSEDEPLTVSAGTDQHDMTSPCSMNSIFKFFMERYERTLHPSEHKSGKEDKSIISKRLSSERLMVRGQGEGKDSEDESDTKSDDEEAGPTKEDNNERSSQIRVVHDVELEERPQPQGRADGENSNSPKSEL